MAIARPGTPIHKDRSNQLQSQIIRNAGTTGGHNRADELVKKSMESSLFLTPVDEHPVCFPSSKRFPAKLKELELQGFWKDAESFMNSLGKSNADEKLTYRPLATILNIISIIYSRENRLNFTIIWMVNDKHLLKGDVFNMKIKPDVIAMVVEKTMGKVNTMGKDKDAIRGYLQHLQHPDNSFSTLKVPPLARLSSPVEVKTNASDRGQLMNYLQIQLRYRIDLSSVVGLFANNTGYQVCYLSPCSAIHTTTYDWKSLDVLTQYVATIYQSEQTKDINVGQMFATDHAWKVVIGPATYVAQPFYSSGPFGRMTRVLIAADTGAGEQSPNKCLRLIKMSFVDASSFNEGDLYIKAHGDKVLRGLAICTATADRQNHGVTDDKIQRVKRLIALGSVGKPLSKCASVLELLKVIYDAVVTLETMVERGVTHRDISRGNVLCKPQHVGRLNGVPVQFEDLPYIEKVLSENEGADGAGLHGETVCHALLTDLDHGENLDSKKSASEAGRTGTPMYAPMELSVKQYEPLEDDYEEFCFRRLKRALGTIQDKYNACFQDNFLQEFNRLCDITPGSAERSQPTGQHRPHHDVESLFWVFSYALVRALPRNAASMEHSVDADKFIDNLVTHHFGIETDNRLLVMMGERAWKKTLHSQLGSLCPMLAAMTTLLIIRWSFLLSDQRSLVVHQAFKRILLAEIYRLREHGDIPLDTDKPREAHARSGRVHLRSTIGEPRLFEEVPPPVPRTTRGALAEDEHTRFRSEARNEVLQEWLNDERWMMLLPFAGNEADISGDD